MNQFKNNYRNSLKYSISSRFAERNTDKFGKVLWLTKNIPTTHKHKYKNEEEESEIHDTKFKMQSCT